VLVFAPSDLMCDVNTKDMDEGMRLLYRFNVHF
jgi:hypothetical protein